MRKTYFILCLSMLTIAFGACCKKRQYCTTDKLSVIFAGFNRSDIRTVWLKRYKAGEPKVKALDSSQFVYNGNAPLPVGNKKDTIAFSDYSRTSGPLNGIYPGNDWLILAQSINGYYTIDLIADEGHTSEIVKCGENGGCINKVAHYFTQGAYHNGNTAYIQK